jgi:hypothetical protein
MCSTSMCIGGNSLRIPNLVSDLAGGVPKYFPLCSTVWDRLFPIRKKTFYRQVLKLGANEPSAQGLQNAI